MVLLALTLFCYGSYDLRAARADLADQHYKRALQAYESKDYPRAIREFQAAYKVRQLPRILLNIGQVYRKLGMASTALKFYEHYLRVEPHPKPAIKAEVDRYIAQTKAMLDPPDIVPLPSGSKAAADAAAAAVAAAPADVALYPYSERSDPGGGNFPPSENTLPPPGGEVQPPSGVGLTPSGRNMALPPGYGRDPRSGRYVDLRTVPPPEKPFYKKPWFWGIVTGVAAGALITGVAVGVSQGQGQPKTVLHPSL